MREHVPIIRRFYWRLRCWLSPVYPWRGSILRSWLSGGIWEDCPHSPRAVFTQVVLGLVDHGNGDLPVEVVLTPSNIDCYVEAHVSSKWSAAGYDAREIWHRTSNHMKKYGDHTDAIVTSCRCPRRLHMVFAMVNPQELNVRIEEGERLPTPREMQERVGMAPGQQVQMSVLEFGEYISSRLLHGKNE